MLKWRCSVVDRNLIRIVIYMAFLLYVATLAWHYVPHDSANFLFGEWTMSIMTAVFAGVMGAQVFIGCRGFGSFPVIFAVAGGGLYVVLCTDFRHVTNMMNGDTVLVIVPMLIMLLHGFLIGGLIAPRYRCTTN